MVSSIQRLLAKWELYVQECGWSQFYMKKWQLSLHGNCYSLFCQWEQNHQLNRASNSQRFPSMPGRDSLRVWLNFLSMKSTGLLWLLHLSNSYAETELAAIALPSGQTVTILVQAHTPLSGAYYIFFHV